MKVKLFQNSNLHLKLTKQDVKEYKKSSFSKIGYIFYKFDLIPVGDEYCIGNYEMALDVAYNGGYKFYKFRYNFVNELFNNKTIILKPHTQKYYNEFLKEIWED